MRMIFSSSHKHIYSQKESEGKMAKLGWEQRISKNSVQYGIEIEFYGMYRIDAIKTVAKTLNVSENNIRHSNHLDGYYVIDNNGKKWEIVSDSSIRNKSGAQMFEKGCELVTPVLNTSDIQTLDNVIDALKGNGGLVSQYCGLHVHASHSQLGLNELVKCIQHMYTRQDLLFRFCKVYTDRISQWCEPTSEGLARKCKKCNSISELKSLWYREYCSSGYSHYDSSRYHNLNLHSFFEGKGIEFRLFNSTLKSEKVNVIIDLCQGFVMDAINSYKMSQYLHTDRTVYTNPDRMKTLLETYADRMQLEPNTKKFLLSENM